ncbi:MAG TPA: aspartate/glutamate racemase family protein [Burkholderiales bacterium]|nr:aspartate/glutamate racemase family protein [Burkholderiales bacterium]
MQSPRIALIHATSVAIDPIVAAFKRLWPEARPTNLLEDSLAVDLAADGLLTETMTERFVALARYARGCGADAILFTCSAFGPAIEAARAALDVPVLKPNEAMLDEALAGGTRIGLIATFAPSIPSLKAELEELAAQKGVKLSIRTSAVPSALAALHDGQPAEHDRLIAAAAAEMGDCEALILGQFSMASAAEAIPSKAGRKVLTSPASAVLRLKQALGG